MTGLRVFFAIFVVLGCSACGAQDSRPDPVQHPQAVIREEGSEISAGPNCLPKKSFTAKKVTHYYVPLLKSFNAFVCNKMEGTCIYEKAGVQWLHNYGYKDQKLASSPCKNGFGNKKDCIHPCRVLAASMSHHRYGEIIYFPELVGKRCGNQARDGLEIVHDGYMVVLDTGSPKHFNAQGRFDFFWGRCKDRVSGICKEGALPVSDTLTNSPYCIAWDPGDALKNEIVKITFVNSVRNEAIARGDNLKGAGFDLDYTVGPSD
jgi:hypothetical protein